VKLLHTLIVKPVRVLATLLMAAVGLVFAGALWHHYMLAPWTRDGRVRAEVVSIAPEVSGTVTEVRIADNQFVHKGDVLFVIDPERYRIAVAQAQATVQAREANRRVAEAKSARRARLNEFATSQEEKEQSEGSAAAAIADQGAALSQLDLAKLNLARTQVRSPVNGYITNLTLRVGDYANAGQKAIAVVDADSFWVAGYFEETKLGAIHKGDPATIRLMGYDAPIAGHIDSLSHGITDQNADPDGQGLATVNPVFTWVRLAQRFPVRIHIDHVPAGIELAAGLTGTVEVGQPPRLTDDVAFVLRWAMATLKSGEAEVRGRVRAP
jgi:multidrug resistance efflux pump